jgi:hypothetical protein
VYEHALTTLSVNQYSSLAGTASDTLISHFVLETTHRIPVQQAVLTRLVSAVVKAKNGKLQKDIKVLLYEKSDHAGCRPLRVSKSKKAEKASNNVKQEACWRCKRYRKAVSLSSLRGYAFANEIKCIGQDICKECPTAGFLEFGHQPSAAGGERWTASLRKSCLVSKKC